MEPAVAEVRPVRAVAGGGMATRGEHPEGRGEDLSGAGELHDGTEVLAMADFARSEAGGADIAFRGGGREEVEGAAGVGDRVRTGGVGRVFRGGLAKDRFLCAFISGGELEDGGGGVASVEVANVGYSLPNVGGGGGRGGVGGVG